MVESVEKLKKMFDKLEGLDPKDAMGDARIKLLKSTLTFIKAIEASDLDHKVFIPVLVGFMEVYSSLVSHAYQHLHDPDELDEEGKLNAELLGIIKTNIVGEA
jgi:hypothetical protein